MWCSEVRRKLGPFTKSRGGLAAMATVVGLAVLGYAGTPSYASTPSRSGNQPRGSAARKGPLQIAGVYSETGGAGPFGILAAQGAKAAVGYINEHGGINGRKLVLDVYDDQSNPEIGVSEVQKIASNPKILGITGFNTVLTGGAEAQLVNEKDIPTIALFGDPQPEKPGKWVFKTAATYSQFADALMRFLHSYEHVNSVGVEFQDNGYGNVVAGWMARYAAKYGIKVTLGSVDPTITDFSVVVKNLLDDGVKSLVSINSTNSGSPINEWKSFGATVPMVLPVGDSNPLAIQGAWPAATGLPVLAYFSATSPQPRQKILVTYFKKHKLGTPQFNDATAWDSVMLLADALGDQTNPTRASIRRALNHIHDYQGTAGIINWSNDSHEGFSESGLEWLKFNGNGGYTYLTGAANPKK